MSYQPTFRYYTIKYVYSYGEVRQGAYADYDLAAMNARLNERLQAEVEEVWF